MRFALSHLLHPQFPSTSPRPVRLAHPTVYFAAVFPPQGDEGAPDIRQRPVWFLRRQVQSEERWSPPSPSSCPGGRTKGGGGCRGARLKPRGGQPCPTAREPPVPIFIPLPGNSTERASRPAALALLHHQPGDDPGHHGKARPGLLRRQQQRRRRLGAGFQHQLQQQQQRKKTGRS